MSESQEPQPRPPRAVRRASGKSRRDRPSRAQEKDAAQRGANQYGPAKIPTKLRYDARNGEELSALEVAFGRAMDEYRKRWHPSVAKHPRPVRIKHGEVIDVLMGLGYTHEVRDFRLLLRRYSVTVEKWRRRRRIKFPLCSELLRLALACGWQPPQASAPPAADVA